jgi:hypothetical protein
MRQKTARAASLRIHMHSAEMDLLRLNAGLQGLSISDYIRQRCLSFHRRKSPM